MEAQYPARIVIDVGSYTTKIGVSGNQSPSFILPSKLPGNNSFVTDSFVTDFGDFEQYFETILTTNFRVSPTDWPVVAAVPTGAGRRYRETLAEIFFETFETPGVYFEECGVLAMHATTTVSAGFSPTALVAELGHSHATLSAVVDGFLVASERFPVGGRDLTDFAVDCLLRREPHLVSGDLATSCRQRAKVAKVAAKAKEEFFFVAEQVLNVHTEFSRNFQKHRKTVCGVEFGFERFLASEILFDPSFTAEKQKFQGLARVVERMVTKDTPVDYRKKLAGNLVLCGGTSLLAGLEKRLKRELPSQLHPGFFQWPTPELQGHAVWTGASVVADSPDFQATRLIPKSAWLEEGSRLFSLKA